MFLKFDTGELKENMPKKMAQQYWTLYMQTCLHLFCWQRNEKLRSSRVEQREAIFVFPWQHSRDVVNSYMWVTNNTTDCSISMATTMWQTRHNVMLYINWIACSFFSALKSVIYLYNVHNFVHKDVTRAMKCMRGEQLRRPLSVTATRFSVLNAQVWCTRTSSAKLSYQ
jgi:hypothetical protein